MPPRLFKKLEFVAIVMVATVGAMVYYALTVLWPTVLGTIYTTDSIKIGWASSVVGGGILLGQVFGGFALSYLPKVKWQLVILSTMGTAFLAAEAGLQPDAYATFITLGVLATFGTSSLLPTNTLLYTNSKHSHRLGRQHQFPRRNSPLGIPRHRPRNRRLRLHPRHWRRRRPNSLRLHPHQQSLLLPPQIRRPGRNRCRPARIFHPRPLRRHHHGQLHHRARHYARSYRCDGSRGPESVSGEL